ncbi:MAG: hypothetical protein CMJ48_10820 [Planctomycetaceae bacterium]|nr:hypothetical protein [Planctomycetaceae bacterium]
MTTQTFDNRGIRFEYPTGWQVAEEHAEGELVVTVSSGETAFWSLSLYFERPDARELIDSAITTFSELYEEVDGYEVAGQKLFKLDALGRDLEFVCLELINTAWLRATLTDRFTALVLAQFTDQEQETVAPILRRITQSLSAEHSHDPFQQWFAPES